MRQFSLLIGENNDIYYIKDRENKIVDIFYSKNECTNKIQQLNKSKENSEINKQRWKIRRSSEQ
jgi:hypothetical protein